MYTHPIAATVRFKLTVTLCFEAQTETSTINYTVDKHQLLICFNRSFATIQVDFSRPSRVLRDYLARRYGVRHCSHYGLQYAGKGKSQVCHVWSGVSFCE